MRGDNITISVEVRESDEGSRLHGVILQEGRAARGGRAELFAPGSVTWLASGIGIKLSHDAAGIETRTVPMRNDGGEIVIETPATPAIVEAVNAGSQQMSVEFQSIRETRTAGGVREIEAALIVDAALTAEPEYAQTTAELRNRNRKPRVWL